VDEQQQPANDVNELENVRADRDRLSVQLHEAENTIENLYSHIDRYENIIDDLKY
jgi:hypothetical protein